MTALVSQPVWEPVVWQLGRSRVRWSSCPSAMVIFLPHRNTCVERIVQCSSDTKTLCFFQTCFVLSSINAYTFGTCISCICANISSLRLAKRALFRVLIMTAHAGLGRKQRNSSDVRMQTYMIHPRWSNTTRPEMFDSTWAKERVSSRACKATDALSVLQSKLWNNSRVSVDSAWDRSCSMI